MKPVSVLQEWVQRLSFMQQSVLITAVRGPDGIEKNHVSKLLVRWLRRCILYSAFESRIHGRPVTLDTPWQFGGGSFTGPSLEKTSSGSSATRLHDGKYASDWTDLLNSYLNSVDGVPHHFQLHFMHAAEILGYKHPNESIRAGWFDTYKRLANDMHLNIETVE